MKQIENIHLNLSTESLPGEIWVDIVNLNGKYQISNLGRLKSLYDCNDNRRDLIRAQGYDKNGYPRLALYDKRKVYYLKIHTIVAEHFLIKPFGTDQINHINGIKADNMVENLEWCTLQQNIAHSIKMSLKKVAFGEKSGTAKLTEKEVLEIYKSENTITSIANKYNVNRLTVELIKKRKNWAHLTKYLPDAPYTKVLSNPELHPKCILSKQKIIQIFKDIRKHKVIAVDYGVSPNYVTNIKLRRTWKTLTKSI